MEKYLKDVELFIFPEKYLLSKVEKSRYQYSSFFEIDKKTLCGWRNFCSKHAVTFHDLLCASIGIALRLCCQNDVCIPQNLLINSVKSTREESCYDEVVGCFLHTQSIKINLAKTDKVEHLAKQVQRAVLETSAYQSSSILVKLAAIGSLNCSKKSIKPFFISLIEMMLSSHRKRLYHLSSPVLSACKRLAKLNPKRGFVININIWNNLFLENQKNISRFFGTTCQTIPSGNNDLLNVQDVLDVCVFKDFEKNTSFLVLSANLKPAFREQLGRVLLNLLD